MKAMMIGKTKKYPSTAINANAPTRNARPISFCRWVAFETGSEGCNPHIK